MTFESKGLSRIPKSTIVEVYRDPQKLKLLYEDLIAVVHNTKAHEGTRLNVLRHINSLQFDGSLQILKRLFDFKSLLADPAHYSYSNDFKAEIFKTINRVGLADANADDKSYLDYIDKSLSEILAGGVPSLDIATIRLMYLFNRNKTRKMFDLNYKLLTETVFSKALPELEASKQYYPIDLAQSQPDFICPGAMLRRDKASYELTSDFATLHSLESIRLYFGHDSLGLSLAMIVRVYLVDHEDNETLVLRTAFDDGVYRVLTAKRSSESTQTSETNNYLTINLNNVSCVSRYIRIVIHHINAGLQNSQDAGARDPLYLVVPFYCGQDTGVSAPVNEAYNALKKEVHQSSYKLEDVVSLGGIDFNSYEKS